MNRKSIMVIHNSFPDFVLFLYVHMALTDGDIHEIEENVILRKLNSLYPPHTDRSLVLNKALADYRQTDPTIIQSIIKDSLSHFEEVKRNADKILNDMFDIINADGHVDEFELETLNSLRNMIQKVK